MNSGLPSPFLPIKLRAQRRTKEEKAQKKTLAKKPVRNERLQLNPSLYAMPAWEMTLDALTISAVKYFFRRVEMSEDI